MQLTSANSHLDLEVKICLKQKGNFEFYIAIHLVKLSKQKLVSQKNCPSEKKNSLYYQLWELSSAAIL